VLLFGRPTDPVVIRLAAEFRVCGIRVLYVWELPAVEGTREPAVLAHTLGVSGLVQVDHESGDARITILERGKPAKEMVVPATGDPAVEAFRTTEYTRAALRADPPVVVDAASGRSQDLRPPWAAVVRELPAHAHGSKQACIGASIGATLASSTDGFGPSAQILGGVSWMPIRAAGLELIALVPVTAAHWSSEAGDAALTFGLATAGPRVEVWSSPGVTIDAGLGLGGAVARSDGRPSPGYDAYQQTTWTVAALARVGVAVRVFPDLRVRIDAMASILMPAVSYGATRNAATEWGGSRSPLLMAALSVEAIAHPP
jgi:hypothetical protein